MSHILEVIFEIIGEIFGRLIVEFLFDIVFFFTGDAVLFVLTFGKHKPGKKILEGTPQHNATSIAIGAIFWCVLCAVLVCPLMLLT
jgi:hypothetical protein